MENSISKIKSRKIVAPFLTELRRHMITIHENNFTQWCHLGWWIIACKSLAAKYRSTIYRPGFYWIFLARIAPWTMMNNFCPTIIFHESFNEYCNSVDGGFPHHSLLYDMRFTIVVLMTKAIAQRCNYLKYLNTMISSCCTMSLYSTRTLAYIIRVLAYTQIIVVFSWK